MAGKTEEKRNALRKKLLKAALTRITKHGIKALRARDLAQDAGCSLGAIYNIYDDLDALAFHAKVEIFTQMERQLDHSMRQASAMTPLEQMVRLSKEYFEFATKNTNLWSALFDGHLTDGHDIPPFYRTALARLMGNIQRPLMQLDPTITPHQASLRTRTLFSAIHGIIVLSIQDRPSGVSTQEVPEAIFWVLESIANPLK
jgi:AcrR family transcriptional regulator